MQNLEIYNKLKAVPETAKKTITGGRLKGMTDISPMWRIKALTEQFGACGFGWYYEIVSQALEAGGKGEVAAFVNINLFVKVGDQWSKAIPGTGGSMFVANEKKEGLHTSDEAFKMALTDAISVACKALGVAADVYWNKDRTKYDQAPAEPVKPAKRLLGERGFDAILARYDAGEADIFDKTMEVFELTTGQLATIKAMTNEL